MDVEQVFPITSFYYQLYGSLAPNILSVTYVQFITGLWLMGNLVATDPFLILFSALLPFVIIVGFPIIFLRDYHHFYSVVDHKRKL